MAAQVLLATTATPPSGLNWAGGALASISTTLSTPGAPARLRMHDLVVLRLHLADRHAPAGGGGRFEHGPSRRAAPSHGLEEMPRAARAVGVLIAEALLVPGRLHHTHALPVGLELVGHDHRHPGPHALAHLGAVAHDRHRAV